MRKLTIAGLLLIVSAGTASQVHEAAGTQPALARMAPRPLGALNGPSPQVVRSASQCLDSQGEGPLFFYEVMDLGSDAKGGRWEAWKQTRSACDNANYVFHRDGHEVARVSDVWEKIGWPECRLASWGQHDFIVLSETGTTGTGVWLTVFKWYLIEGGQALKVLELPKLGNINGWGMEFDREFTSQWAPVTGQWPRIRYTIDVDWHLGGDETWCLQSRLDYDLVWHAGLRTFLPTQSGKWRDPWDFWTCGHDEFVLNQQAEIRAGVASREARYVDWLEAMRTRCKDSRAIDLIEVWRQELAG